MDMFVTGLLFGLGFWLAKGLWELLDKALGVIIEWFFDR
jgi:hypothetical protein